MAVDAMHDFDRDVMSTTVFDEGGLEAGVAPQSPEPPRACSGGVGDGDPAGVVRSACGDATTASSSPRVSTIPKVLRPFNQVEDIMSRSHVGAGLGLPITTTLLKHHGGTLAIESEIGRGTVVTARFPPERVRPG